MKTNKILSLSLTALLALGFCACSDDDTDKTPLSDPSAAVASSSASSLTFAWNKVEGARQYGCELKDASGEVIDAQVVDATEVTFTGLRPSTTYTLDVTAYASVDGDKGNSKAFTLTGTTADATKLAEPVLNYTLEAGYANVYWDEVEGATEYAYTYSQNGTVESGTTTNTYFYIPTTPYAEYAVSVYATSSDPSYQNSDTARLTFTMWRDEAWSATGTYTSFHLGESFESAVVAYSDNTYSILAFYGVEGYNFDFSVNGGVIQPLSSYETDSNGDYMIPTGRTDFPTILVSTAYGKQSTFSGNEREGSIRIVTCNYPEGADTFEWKPMSSGDRTAFTIPL